MEQTLNLDTIRGGVHVEQRHDSAHKHVTGLAEYADDIPEPAGTLHAYLGLGDRAHAEIVAMDLEAVRAAPGVVGVLTAADITGQNDISPTGKHDDPVFAARSSSTASRSSPSSPRPATRRGGRRSSRRCSTASCRTSPTWPRRWRPTTRSSPSR